jgi:hypothetical protein
VNPTFKGDRENAFLFGFITKVGRVSEKNHWKLFPVCFSI